jgi:flagellar motility protein MotE (MotC chaperone)
MSDIYTDIDKKEIDDPDIQEDKQVEIINDIKDDEELAAAKELILEDLSEPDKGTSDGSESSAEPNKPTADEKDKGTSDLDKSNSKDAADQSITKDKADDFVLTDEKINSYPEEFRGILQKYKGKSREELEKAIANAVLFRNYQDVVKALVDTQRETGSARQPEKPKTTIPKPDELPPLQEDNEEVQKVIAQESVKRLKEIYPGMPDDLNSEEGRSWQNSIALRQLKTKYPDMPDDPYSLEYQDFIREMQDVNPDKAYDFQFDKRQAIQNLNEQFNKTSSQVKQDLKQLIYIQNNHVNMNNTRLENEVNGIKAELQKLGLTEKDFGIDLSLSKDNDGLLYNGELNNLMLNGDMPDPNVISYVGRYPILKEGLLKQKFLYTNSIKLANLLASKKISENRKELERLKDTNLNSLGGSSSNRTQGSTLTLEQISNGNPDDAVLKREKEKLLAEF